MDYTEEQQSEFKATFATRRRRQRLVTIPLLIFILTSILVRKGVFALPAAIPREMYLPGFLFVVVGAFVFSLWNWRCPACKGYLGRGTAPSFCRKCGVGLR